MSKKKKRFIHIGSIVNKSLKRFRKEAGGELPKVWDVWNSIVGKAVSENAQPKAFRGKLLLVNVKSPVWTQHLQFQKAFIIKKVNDIFGKAMIEDIRFEIGEV